MALGNAQNAIAALNSALAQAQNNIAALDAQIAASVQPIADKLNAALAQPAPDPNAPSA